MTTLGIIGGGQLGRMLALAALPLGVQCRFLAGPDEAPIQPFATRFAADDLIEVDRFARGCTAVTAEFEAIELATLQRVDAFAPLRPGAAALLAKQDRIVERNLLTTLQLPQPRWAAATANTLASACAEIGYPCRVKVARGGYDGRGQWRLRSPNDLVEVPPGTAPWVVEEEIRFEHEFSLIASRSLGSTEFWPATFNEHRDGILTRSVAAAGLLSATAAARAQDMVSKLLTHLDYCGTLAVEFFRLGDQVLINEFAPRVHNSGHWTIEGAVTSQFENHVRAVLHWPLGSSQLRSTTRLWNVLGEWPKRSDLLAIAGIKVHDYGKAPRPNRKIGHLCLTEVEPNDPRIAAVDRLLHLPTLHLPTLS